MTIKDMIEKRAKVLMAKAIMMTWNTRLFSATT